MLLGLVILIALPTSATAVKGRHCKGSITAHHVRCEVAERVVHKWRRSGFSDHKIKAGGTKWHCWFIDNTDYFNCFSDLNGRVTGQIKNH